MQVLAKKIQQFIVNNNTTQVEIVNILKRFDNQLFSGLDVNTLNRWLNNKSNPNLQKRISLALALKLDLFHYIDSTEQKMSSKHEYLVNDYFNKVDAPLLNYGYLEHSNIRLTFRTMGKAELRSEFDSYYNNIPPYISLRNKMDTLNKDYKFEVITAYMQDVKVGHCAYIEDVEALCKTANLDYEQFKNHICVIPLYYTSSDVLKSLFSEFMIKLASKQEDHNRKIIVLVANTLSLKFFDHYFMGKIIKYLPKASNSLKHDKGIYIYELNYTKILSLPYIYNLVKDNISR